MSKAIKLKAENFCKHQYNTSDGRHCSADWSNVLFQTFKLRNKFYKHWLLVAKDMNLSRINTEFSMEAVNDAPRNRLSDLAKCFNKALDNMGYEIVEVEV